MKPPVKKVVVYVVDFARNAIKMGRGAALRQIRFAHKVRIRFPLPKLRQPIRKTSPGGAREGCAWQGAGPACAASYVGLLWKHFSNWCGLGWQGGSDTDFVCE